MPRQRNDTGGVLLIHEIGLQVGPGEEFDCRLMVPGCTSLEEPAPEDPAGDPPGGDAPPDGGSPADDDKLPRRRGGKASSEPETEATE